MPKYDAKQWACLGGAALFAGICALPIGPKPLPDVINSPSTTENQPAKVQVAAVSPQPVIKNHTVKDGDTLSGIAEQYGIDLETLEAANPGISELIHPGDELVILPQKGAIHQVSTGDTLWDIAHTYGVQIESIKTANAKDSDQVAAGEKLFIPGARWARVDTAVARGSASRFIWPTKGEISSPFGWRWGRLHEGVDIANDIGTYVMSARAGQVIWAGWRGGYGYAVMIDHGGGYVSLYGHLSDFYVERGQFVRAGQRIASMGNTGNSTGPHLHFEIQKDGQPVDPMGYLP
ncbi:peptidoglycan DD-metalloendopeptidase family protein [Sporomusa acidovorans]|uniref:LysM domain-containing protein n=1 Tax=Sporomusa acidovorans (strain ATCC 49682 / DSM 3132 / Mol) TaxID=1123286 RepID=A0ABZ3IWQ0_SPOA4|nr:M23 family metallopeptidase [Sporomusa acidovorans]OZC23639.1 murein DD-endopeptidase MepM [Sporomusa acidovorans DSM 3132]SDE23535.1 Murein DD-endopeptidase MepM and murein hydrolase activator NlpD, contain LysM domain [Sporomusa acidovorans]